MRRCKHIIVYKVLKGEGDRMAEEKAIAFPHCITLDERHNLTVSGVTDIGGYDEQTIVAVTSQGELTIKGEGLHIIKMSVEMGELIAQGVISSLQYSEMKAQSDGFFARLFR